ncbi:membrane protein [Oleiphilus messinensis]|uniref:Membrane protein n=1 Tax=Oleiphilus messinensis TaxID=141451 RepID=A0A1Y0IGR4_9GAMM|nr:energy-coupling factor ABC transporter permease [Oleiphilus messinensis]ARU58715.1 membrane protein [Oleiphilus messinensis]
MEAHGFILQNGALWITVCTALICVAVALGSADWLRLTRDPDLQHSFLGGGVALLILWQMKAYFVPGMSIHFLGVTALTLLLGWPFAVLMGCMVCVADFAIHERNFNLLALGVLSLVIAPSLITLLVVRLEKLAGFRLFFSYIFICGFFGAAFSAAAGALVCWLLLLFAGIITVAELFDLYLKYLPLIMLPEAVINGMVITGLLVFCPDWLNTLDSDRYGRSG